MQYIFSAVPSWATEHVLEKKSLFYNGKTYEYLVISHLRVGVPRIFVLFTNGALAISDTYPEKYRELALIHEIMEMSQPAPFPEDACMKALKKELIIAEQLCMNIAEYVAFRTSFFSQLIEYYERQPLHEVTTSILARLRHSLAFLRNFRP